MPAIPEQNRTKQYVYMIRAGDAVKVGITYRPKQRWWEHRRGLLAFGKPIFIGCVEGSLADERHVHSLGTRSVERGHREMFDGDSLPDIGKLFPDRVVYQLPPAQHPGRPAFFGVPTTKMCVTISVPLLDKLIQQAKKEGVVASVIVNRAIRRELEERTI